MQAYKLQTEISKLSRSVGLYKDLKTRVKKLSIGMKRRLSFALSLIGDSKVIILGKSSVFILKLFHKKIFNI